MSHQTTTYDKKAANHSWYLKNKDKVKCTTNTWYKNNKERGNQLKRAANVRHKYGLDVKTYDRLINSCCAICGERVKIMHLDHCHKTKKLRGVLCIHCNAGLGQFKDSPSLLLSAVYYLGENA